jgi:DNA polymerase III delta' subunit
VNGARTRGQPAALGSIRAMLGSGVPHAVLLTGPAGVGKTTLALDLAAGLLCTGASGRDRPCGRCRGCRMVASGNHPDLHRLAPGGPGGQIRIGRRDDAEPGTIRRLVSNLALLPVEGGARVAIIERADRMNEDAQSALLKTLEEPPAGVTIVLCADDEERLLDTVRSRCARVRLGSVAVRDLEDLLAERGVADPPLAARLARLSGGRPGTALAYALAPDAVTARAAIARELLDLVDAGPARRLEAIGTLLVSSADHLRLLDPSNAGPVGRAETVKGTDGKPGATDEPGATGRTPASERRRAALALLEVWRDVARDLAVAALGNLRGVRDTGMLDDLAATAPTIDPAAVAGFLARLARTGALVDANVGPELALDVLVLAWPHRAAVA